MKYLQIASSHILLAFNTKQVLESLQVKQIMKEKFVTRKLSITRLETLFRNILGLKWPASPYKLIMNVIFINFTIYKVKTSNFINICK